MDEFNGGSASQCSKIRFLSLANHKATDQFVLSMGLVLSTIPSYNLVSVVRRRQVIRVVHIHSLLSQKTDTLIRSKFNLLSAMSR